MPLIYVKYKVVVFFSVLPVKVMDWFKDDVFRLIDLYRDRPCLWDNDDIDRRDKAKKEESWNEISDILHVERAEVERKMKSLSTQFYREYKRKIKIETETGSDEGFRSKWFAYERLSFLSRRVKDRPTMCYYGSEVGFCNNTHYVLCASSCG